MPAKWSSNGPVGQALRREIIQNNYIEKETPPATVWKNNPLYHKHYKLENFRTNYNKMKNKIKEELNEKCSGAALDELHTAFNGKILIRFLKN